MATDYHDQIPRWIATAKALREEVVVPPSTAPPPDVHEALVRARSVLDRMEEVLASAMAGRANLRVRASQARDDESDAWDDEYANRKQTGRYRNEDFKSGREKEAEINLAIRGQRQAARNARDMSEAGSVACDLVWLRYNSVRAIRDDLLQRLRALAFESHLERP